MRIGFAGLGAMGGPMAGHLLDAGHKLLVLTRRRESAAAAIAKGAVWAGTAKALAAGSEIVFTVLPGPAEIEAILRDPNFLNVHLDISWDEVAKYFVASPEATKELADLIERYPDRFLFGSDAAAPADQSKYLKVFYQYGPLWESLDAETSRKVRLRNYERIFDEARRKVRSWENAHVPSVSSN